MAADDVWCRRAGGLGAYYAERGESPGRWLGSGLTALGIEAGLRVDEAQMVALFGHGRHPDADSIELDVLGAGGGIDEAMEAANLGPPFPVAAAESDLTRSIAKRLVAWNSERGVAPSTPVPASTRSRRMPPEPTAASCRSSPSG